MVRVVLTSISGIFLKRGLELGIWGGRAEMGK